jgi:hypothetical protein
LEAQKGSFREFLQQGSATLHESIGVYTTFVYSCI